MGNYQLLMEEFYTDFKMNNCLSKLLKKYLKITISMLAIYIIYCIFYSVLKNPLGSTLHYSVTAGFWIIFIGFIFLVLRKSSKNKLEMKKQILNHFNRLLDTPKYHVFYSLSMLNELEKSYQNKIIAEPSYKNKLLDSIISILIPLLISQFIIISIINPTIQLGFILITLLAAIFIKMAVELIKMYYIQNDTDYISIILTIIQEKRIEILDSRNDSIINKIKYTLKLGIYS